MIERLTERQRELLRLLCAGKTPREAAAALGVGEGSVYGRMGRIRTRTGQKRIADVCVALAGEAPPAPAGRPDPAIDPALAKRLRSWITGWARLHAPTTVAEAQAAALEHFAADLHFAPAFLPAAIARPPEVVRELLRAPLAAAVEEQVRAMYGRGDRVYRLEGDRIVRNEGQEA